jgi:hypothetical protein
MREAVANRKETVINKEKSVKCNIMLRTIYV